MKLKTIGMLFQTHRCKGNDFLINCKTNLKNMKTEQLYNTIKFTGEEIELVIDALHLAVDDAEKIRQLSIEIFDGMWDSKGNKHNAEISMLNRFEAERRAEKLRALIEDINYQIDNA